MIVRPSEPADFDAVDHLLRRVYPKLLAADYPADVLVASLPRISRARPELVGCPTYFVAEEAGEIRAAGGWTPDRNDPSLAHIRHVVCDDRHLRRGIARSVMTRSLDTARNAQIKRMECWSTRTAERFYRAIGFETHSSFEIDLGDGVMFPALRMSLDL